MFELMFVDGGFCLLVLGLILILKFLNILGLISVPQDNWEHFYNDNE